MLGRDLRKIIIFGKLLAVAFSLVITLALAGCTVIPEGRSAVDQIEVNGAKKIDGDDLKEKIATKVTPKFVGLFRGIVYEYELYDGHVLAYDLARVERYYRARGYYDAHARAGRVTQVSKNHVRVEIVVEEGVPTLITQVRYNVEHLPRADNDAMLNAQISSLPLGALLDEDKLNNLEKDVKRGLEDIGYAKVTVQVHSEVDLALHESSLVITVVPKEKCVFGKVNITGLGELPEPEVRRVLDIDEGAVYSRTELERARQDLLDMGVVSSVDLVPQLEGAPEGVIPISVKLERTRLRTIRIGGGIELDALKTDLHLRTRWEDRNFLGGLRSFSVDFTPGVVLYPTRTNDFELPKLFLPEEKLKFELRRSGFVEAQTTGFVRPEFNVFPVLLQTEYDSAAPVLGYFEFRTTEGVERSFGKLRAVLSHSLQIEYPFNYRGGPLDESVRTLVISYPELVTTIDLRDDKVHPHKGVYLSNDLQVAGIGGQPTDIRIQPEVRAYTPIGSRRFILAARATLGFLFPFNYESGSNARDAQLLFFRGFFSGGPTQNRGYPPRGVGPQGAVPFYDPSIDASQIEKACASNGAGSAQCEVPLGGTTLWEASVELRTLITGPISLVTFCDASDVAAKVATFHFDRPHLSCGLGGRYDTPVGPFRLDIGYRIPGMQSLSSPAEYVKNFLGGSDNQSGIPIAIQLGLGEAF